MGRATNDASNVRKRADHRCAEGAGGWREDCPARRHRVSKATIYNWKAKYGERWRLDLYWDAEQPGKDISRAQGLAVVFDGIVRQWRRAGRYEDVGALGRRTPEPAEIYGWTYLAVL